MKKLLLLIYLITFMSNLLADEKQEYIKKDKLLAKDSLPPNPEWHMCCSGNVNNCFTVYVHDKPDLPGYRSNLKSITLDTISSYNYELYYENFDTCYDSYTSWGLNAINHNEDSYGVVTFSDCAGNDTTIYLYNTARKIKVEDQSWNFGNVKPDEKIQKIFKLINYSKTDTFKLDTIELKISSKNSNNGFSVLDETGEKEIVLPLLLYPFDTLRYMVKFENSEENYFWDSIGFGNICGFNYIAYVEAKVGLPKIEVNNFNFQPLKINEWSSNNIYIKNIGTVELEITGFDGPHLFGKNNINQIFSSYDLKYMNISEKNPLIIMPNDSVSFEIIFSPDEAKQYKDSIVFFSNSDNQFKNICYLAGGGLLDNFFANGYNWGRKRITRPGFEIPEYPAIETETQQRAIVLKNELNSNIQIINVKEITRQGDISAFRFDIQSLICTIKAHDSIYVPVSFLPASTGLHLLTFEYVTSDPTVKNRTSTLQGYGILPKISTRNIDFGSTYLNDFIFVNQKSYSVQNLSLSEWEWGDSVTIMDFKEIGIRPDITSDWLSFPESFRYEKESIIFPIILQPGEEYVMDQSYFVARDTAGNPEGASITTLSDAEMEVTSNWVGRRTGTYVDENSLDNFHIYPNPAQDKLIITGLKNISKISVIDMLGNNLYMKNFDNDNFIDVSGLNNGIYILKIISGRDVFVEKFVIQK